MRRVALVAALLAALSPGIILAHGGLRFSSPVEGATLGDTPVAVQLTFSERPDPAVSTIQVLDAGGVRHDVGAAAAVPGEPLAIAVRVRPLAAGVYRVNWRVVSAIDGHPTAGSYAFGVRASPDAASTRATTPQLSRLEVAGRWILIAGLILLLGVWAAETGGFGGSGSPKLAVAAGLVAAIGVSVLAVAQTRAAGVAMSSLPGTSMGRALAWRAAAIGLAIVAAAAIAVARPASGWLRVAATACIGLAASFAMAVHVVAGHAGAGRTDVAGAAAVQWLHFAASGVWLGGLAALLIGLRGRAAEERARRVRRFSTLAAASILVVVLTGVVRGIHELTEWADLLHTSYGRALAFKSAFVLVIAALGAVNRWRSVPRLARAPRLLTLVSSGELAVAAVILFAASLLGALPPPAGAVVVPGISAAGADFATTVRVTLSALSDQPGPNRFTAHVADYDSKEPVTAERVSLRFIPVDDPGVLPTSLALTRQPDGAYAGSGANLAFDGRWRVTVRVEQSNRSVEVPLDVDVKGRSEPVVVSRMPGKPVTYTVVVRGLATLQFSPSAERPGSADLSVGCYDFIWDERRVEQMVMTIARDGEPPRQLPLKRVGVGRFVAPVNFAPGRHTVSAVAKTVDGTRVRAATEIVIPDR